MKVVFSKHARSKFVILAKHGVHITQVQVRDTVRHPERTEPSRKGRYVAQKGLTATLVLRVVCHPIPGGVEVVTFYPGRRDRYAS